MKLKKILLLVICFFSCAGLFTTQSFAGVDDAYYPRLYDGYCANQVIKSYYNGSLTSSTTVYITVSGSNPNYLAVNNDHGSMVTVSYCDFSGDTLKFFKSENLSSGRTIVYTPYMIFWVYSLNLGQSYSYSYSYTIEVPNLPSMYMDVHGSETLENYSSVNSNGVYYPDCLKTRTYESRTITQSGFSSSTSVVESERWYAKGFGLVKVSAEMDDGGTSVTYYSLEILSTPPAPQPPVSFFASNTTSGSAPLTVNFDGSSSEGDISSWLWNFGDSTTSIDRNPTHVYQQSGTFNVSLTVTGAGGTDTETKTGYVTVIDSSTIQARIDEAVNGDTILLADGVYTGPGNYNIDLKGKSVTVKSVNGPNKCIIDCQQLGRGFLVYNCETVYLTGVTIKNADSKDNSGGAVNVSNSDITIVNCVFNNNKASRGSAVYSSSLLGSTFISCTFTKNNDRAVSCSHSDFIDCTFTSNSGGAVVASFSTFTNCTFTNNGSSSSSGGAVAYNASAAFANCTFTRNIASSGGAVSAFFGLWSSSTFTNCIFANNSAAFGGATYFPSPSSFYITYQYHSSSFTNCSLANNEAIEQGGAIWCDTEISEDYPIVLKNCILWGNIAPEGPEIYEQEEPIIATYSDIQGGYVGEGNINNNPLFLSIDTTGDLYLHPDSPCIDTGTADGAPADDIDDYLRPIGIGYDMGAYEYRYNIFIWEGQTFDWHNISNWNYSALPKSTDIVIISSPAAVTEPVINSNTATVGTLLIESGTLTIDQGKLTIGGS